MAKEKKYPEELIGEIVEIIDSKNKSNLAMLGKVIDETKHTLKIQSQEKVKILFKNNITLKLIRTGQLLEGKLLKGRPEERLKGR